METERPAIVKDVNAELCAAIKAKYAVILVRHRANLDDAIQIGHQLAELRKKHKEKKNWLAALATTGMSRRTAERYMHIAELAELQPEAIAACCSINQALSMWEEKIGNDPSGRSDEEEVKVYCLVCHDLMEQGCSPTPDCTRCAEERASRQRKKDRRLDDDGPMTTFSLPSVSSHHRAILTELDKLAGDYELPMDHPAIVLMKGLVKSANIQIGDLRDALKKGDDPSQVVKRAFRTKEPKNAKPRMAADSAASG